MQKKKEHIMNYLERLAELKRQEAEKKQRLEKIREDKEKNKDEYLSNLTFIAFEQDFLSHISEAIEKGLNKKEFDNKTKIEFRLINSNLNNNLNKSEFLEYIKHIPGLVSIDSIEGGAVEKFQFTFELDTLITYYYEKLQELEYYSIDYNESKSR